MEKLWLQYDRIFLAGLNNIPKEYYEAAAIDGYSKVGIFFRITLPLLLPNRHFCFHNFNNKFFKNI